MLRHAYSFSLLLLLLLASCSSQTALSIAPTPESVILPIIDEIEGDPSFQKFLLDLSERNVELTSAGISRVAWLSVAPGIGYRVGRYWMNLHLYPDAAAARENANEIQENADVATVSWIAPPHFFLCDRIIALYLGLDEAVTAALTELCGPRFAGLPEQAD